MTCLLSINFLMPTLHQIYLKIAITRYIYIGQRGEERRAVMGEKRRKRENRSKSVCVIFIPPLVCVNTLPMRRCRRS